MKSKEDKLEVDKLKPFLLIFLKIRDIVDNNVVKNTAYNELVKNVDVIDTSRPVNKIDYDAKIEDIEDEISSTTNLTANVSLSAVKEKRYQTLVVLQKKADYDAKKSDIEKKYFTTSF